MATVSPLKRPAPYRIRDLVRKTGITKETIHYYITEGLLPKAEKTSKNMAWYGDEHIERLETIKALQQKQFLPLKAIKAVLTDSKNYTFTPDQERTIHEIQRSMRAVAGGPRASVALADVQAGLALSSEDVAELEGAGLIKIANGRLSEEDAQVCGFWAQLRDIGFNRERGFSPADLEMVENVAALLFDQEVRLLTERFENFDGEEAARAIEGALPSMHALFALLHNRKVRNFIEHFKS